MSKKPEPPRNPELNLLATPGAARTPSGSRPKWLQSVVVVAVAAVIWAGVGLVAATLLGWHLRLPVMP